MFRCSFITCSLERNKDIETHVFASSQYSLEFAHDGVFSLVFIRFWRENQLNRVFTKRTGRLMGLTQAEVSLVSFVMGTLSTDPNLISGTSQTAFWLDTCPYTKHGLPRFEEISLQNLMHKKSYSAFGRTDFSPYYAI